MGNSIRLGADNLVVDQREMEAEHTGQSSSARGRVAETGIVTVGFEEMKQLLIAILAVALVSGCSGKKPVPASRLRQSAGGFSFVTPDGWFRTKLPGLDFIVVSTGPDYGANPNIFVEGAPRSGTVSDRVAQMTEANRDEIRAYVVLQKYEFTTESGLNGVKIAARRETKEALPLAVFHFMFQDGDRVIVVTCSCAEPVKQKYESLFDAAMRSLRSER